MSAPPDRHGATTPLHQRTQSQNQSLGIRIVPYTPPTIDAEGRVPSQASTRSQTTTTTTGGAGRDSGLGHGNYDDQTIRRPSWIGGVDRDEDYASSSNPGSALSSSSVSSLLLVKAKDEGVSVPKLASYPSAPLGSRDPIAPDVRSPSEVSSNITPINASALHAASRTQAIQGRFGEPPPSPVPASPASSTGPPRPLSRRRIVVVTHADKTFSLVRESQSDALAGITSPALSTSYSSRPTTSSHAPPSIDAWSEGRPSSPAGTSTSATILDNSLSELPVPSTPSTPSPGPYSKHLAEDHITSSPWNYRMVGGLRKVAKTPDLKGKDSATTLTQERLLAPLPEIIVDREEEEEEEEEEKDEQETRTVVPKASFASIDSAQTFSTTSETTNYKVYGASSSPQPSIDSLPLLPSSSNNPSYEVLGESSSPNYRILGESSSPNYEVIGPSSSPNLEGIAESSSPNYRIVGESSSPNYEVIGESSSPNFELLGPSSSPNYEIIAETSSLPAPLSSTPPRSSDSEENYVLHGDPSPSPSSSAILPRQPRPTYSQESLVVPPLRPAKKKSYEGFGYYKQRSRENLRGRAGSLQSLKSISSIITTQDATQVVAPVFLNFGASSSRDARAGYSGSTSQQQQQQLQQQQSPWSGPQAPGSSTGSYTPQSAINQRPVQMIQAHPHQWSSQLSTVMSESEESERSPSRSASPSISGGNSHRRRSSLGWGSSSLHSRQLQSISSSLAAQLEEGASGTESPERPQPTLSRSTLSHPPMVRDQDEHGDGITDLADQPSRSGLSAFFMSSNSSSRNLHSSASSRSNSFTSASIPAWARVYYGSGERKFLGAPSIAGSDVGDHSRPPSMGIYGASNSPSPDHYSMAIYNQRKRAREINPHPRQRPFSDSASMDIAPAPIGDYNVFRSIKRKTSSIWSPHLRQDRRASRYSVWNPPSVSWSADSRILGKRNVQVVLFIVGFIFPFAWMIAALLPLPPNPKFEMLERGDNDGHHRSRSKLPDFRTVPPPRPRIVDETRFESARWWRNLNRIMSFVGLLIIGAVIALAVIGVREHWVVDSSSSS